MTVPETLAYCVDQNRLGRERLGRAAYEAACFILKWGKPWLELENHERAEWVEITNREYYRAGEDLS